MPTIRFKKNDKDYYKQVDDGANSITIKLTCNDDYFEALRPTTESIDTFDDLDESDWDDLLASYYQTLDFVNEFVGGHPPHMPQPTRPK